MSTYKPLLPRTQEAGAVREKSVEPATNRRKAPVAAACEGCHLRKVKCDGTRPTCGACRARRSVCTYDVEAGLTRRQGVKRKQQELQDNVESFSVLYEFLQNRKSADAIDLLHRIRNGTSLEDALEFVKAQSAGVIAAPPIDPGLAWAQQMHYSNLLLEDELLSAASSDMTMMALRNGVDCFYTYLGTMFPIFTRDEVENHILPTYLGPPHEKSKATAAQVIEKRMACGELLAMCAVGHQYNRQTLPSGDASICTPFYQKARLFLDYVMEHDALRAMRICCCLGMYNVIAKSGLGVTYTDWGIFLASSRGLGLGRRPVGLSEEDYSKYSKVFKALITVRSWVTATLGHVPSPEVARYIHETRAELQNGLIDCTATGNVIDVLQQNMTMITILKANILRTLACFESLTPTTLTEMRNDIQQWYDGLPGYMSLDSLTRNPSISPDQRRVTFYMHLFHMSAIMLKARAVLADEAAAEDYFETPEVRLAVAEGVEASRSSGRLLRLLYDEKAVVKNCWLTIYQCYITCLVLNYTLAVSAPRGLKTPETEQDRSLARVCIDILALCATMDPIAKKFLQRCQQIHTLVEDNMGLSSDAEPRPTSTPQDTYREDARYAIPQKGDTEMHRLQDDLRKMCCYPLASHRDDKGGKMPPIPVVEVIVNGDVDFAHHLASPFNTDGEVEPTALFPPDDDLDGEYVHGGVKEGFLSGSVPYSWSHSVWAGRITVDGAGDIMDGAPSS